MNMPRYALIVIGVCVLVGCTAARPAHGNVVLLAQPPDSDPSHVGLGFYSSSHPRPTRNFKRGDDFVLSEDVRVNTIRWWGQSEGRVFDDLRNFDQYTVEIFEGTPAGGGPLPGSLVWSSVLSLDALTITATGRISPINGSAEHVYEAQIPTGVELEGGQAYVLAISARSVTPSSDAWQWQDAEAFGGHGAIFSYSSGAWSAFQDTDSAFELLGTPVPAPGPAAVLMLAGIRAARRGVRRASCGGTTRASSRTSA